LALPLGLRNEDTAVPNTNGGDQSVSPPKGYQRDFQPPCYYFLRVICAADKAASAFVMGLAAAPGIGGRLTLETVVPLGPSLRSSSYTFEGTSCRSCTCGVCNGGGEEWWADVTRRAGLLKTGRACATEPFESSGLPFPVYAIKLASSVRGWLVSSFPTFWFWSTDQRGSLEVLIPFSSPHPTLS
jgi:hypothetical protein